MKPEHSSYYLDNFDVDECIPGDTATTWWWDASLSTYPNTAMSGEERLVFTLIHDALATLKQALSTNSRNIMEQAICDWEWLFSGERESPIPFESICWWFGFCPEKIREMVLQDVRFPDSIEELHHKLKMMEAHPEKFVGWAPRKDTTPDW